MESSVKYFDRNRSRISFFLQQCAEMDAMPMEKRQDTLAFVRAMTALEGLPAKEETEKNLQLWAHGEKRFTDFYIEYLQSRSIIEDDWRIKSGEQTYDYMEEGEKNYDPKL